MDEMSCVSSIQDQGVGIRSHVQKAKDQVALVVTSDTEIRKRCLEAAQSAGLSVECAERGVTALNLARALIPDVILLDVELRDVNGLELVTWLRSDQTLRNVPVIAFSTFAGDRVDPRFSATSGVVALLAKPLQIKELGQLVRKVI